MRDFRYFDNFLSIQYHQFLHHSFGDVWQKTRNIRYTPVTHIQSVHHEHNTCTSEDMGRFCLNLIKSIHQIAQMDFQKCKIFQLLRGAHPPHTLPPVRANENNSASHQTKPNMQITLMFRNVHHYLSLLL